LNAVTVSDDRMSIGRLFRA